jgi:epoxyqueuosine reductase
VSGGAGVGPAADAGGRGDEASSILARELKDEALRLGFDRVGIAAPDRSDHGLFYQGWLERGYHGEMTYLARPDAVDRRVDPALTLPAVRSIVVVADAYPNGDAPGVPADPAVGVVARYARGADYHRVLRRKLEALRRWTEERLEVEGEAAADSSPAGDGRAGKVYVDTGPLLERELGRRAGLGWFGRNTMLIHPQRGSYFFLGALLLEVPLPPDPPFEVDRCGSCHACLDACPTGALLGRDAAGAPVMDARRCISYLTIELRGAIPRELRPAIGNRIFGCDICQEVCPWNQRFPEQAATEARYAARGPGELPVGVEALPGESPVTAVTERAGRAGAGPLHPGTDGPALIELLETALVPAAWDAFSRASPLRRPGRTGFARNVCVALGNWGSPDAVPALVAALGDDEPLVRGHAAWALGRVATPEATNALARAVASEADPFVCEELERALESPIRE